jgi:thiamine-phosphate pyrophosphorylase
VIAPLPRLHAVTDDRIVAHGGIVERAAAMAAVAGPRLGVHLRTRSMAGAELLGLARRLGEALGTHGSWLVVNDRVDVARAAGADAIALGRSGLAVRDARRVAPGVPVGRAVHDAAEARAAGDEGADFLVAGAVFATASHPAAVPAGPALVTAAAAGGLPVIAIGGITPANATTVLGAGAWGVAAIRALWDAADPAEAARAFLAVLPAAAPLLVAVNGESRAVAAGTTLGGLLAQLGLDPRAVVVEHNRHIVRRDGLAQAVLAGGDTIELVHFVGGG